MITDIKSLTLGILFTIAIFGPFVYFIWLGRKRLRKTQQVINRVGLKRNLNFTEKEIWNDRGLAIDPLKRMIWVDTSSSNYKWKVIDLAKVQSCNVIDTQHIIQLIITYKDQKWQPFEVITLFDAKVDDPFEKGFHTILSKKWRTRINELTDHTNSPYFTPERAA